MYFIHIMVYNKNMLLSKNACRDCGSELERQEHKKWKDKYLNQSYCFKAWNKCNRCNKLFMIDSEKCSPEELRRVLQKQETLI